MTALGGRLLDDLVERADEFEFFQAVRLAQLDVPPSERVGGDCSTLRERVRFRPWLSLAFSGPAVRQVDAPLPPARNHFRFTVGFLGLYGPVGTLPVYYTELLLARAKLGDHALREFLDMVNHRFTSFFFLANEKHRPIATCRLDGTDAISSMLYSLMGLTLNARRAEAGLVPRRHLLRYAGLWTQKPRSLKATEALLADYFPAHATEVRQHVGRWVYLPESEQGRVKHDPACNRLGDDIVVGHRVWDRSGNFRVRVGPMSLEEYMRFQPGGDQLPVMASLVREFVGDHLWFDVQPVLRAEEIPALQLSKHAAPGPRLGRTTWLVSRQRAADGDEPTFNVA